jgi:hypothetical protein
MGGGQKSGKASRFRGKIMLGATFAIVELLDPRDSLCFAKRMRRKGLRDLTPPSEGNTFRSKRPTEDWMKQVANLDPDWWYISGHFARTPHYKAFDEDQQKTKTIIPLFPKKIQLWEVTIETLNLIRQGGLFRGSFGLRVKTTRKIEVSVENDKFKGEGETSIIEVAPHATPKNRYIYTPITNKLAGSGTVAEQEQWDWKTAEINGVKCYRRFLRSKPKKFLDKLEKLESHETPFCFPFCSPKKYPVKVNKGSDEIISKGNQSKLRNKINLKFKFSKTIDNTIGYCVASRWEIGQNVWEEPEHTRDSRRLKWNNPRDHAQIIVWLRAGTSLFQPLYERFIFADANDIVLDNGWKTSIKYPIKECGRVGLSEDGLKRCKEGERYSRVHPKSTDKIKVKLIKQKDDKSQDASFFNKTYYDNEYQSKEQANPDSWRIRMEYAFSRDELKTDNFFEEHGSGSYSNAKVVILMSCNTLALASVRKYYSELFPKAIFLGHIHKNPANSTPIIQNFLNEYFSDPAKAVAYDFEHIASSWLSYQDKYKNSISRRGYGLAVMHEKKVYGVEIDNSYSVSTPIAEEGETVQRLKLKSLGVYSGAKKGRKIDVLIVWDANGEIKTHKGMYEGEGEQDFRSPGMDPYRDTYSPPFLTGVNLLRNRGY